MTRDTLATRIVFYEWMGFGVVCVVLWMNELVDIPHMLGGIGTPVNWIESSLESVLVLLLCLLVTYFTRRCMRRIKYLEGFLSICSYCKKIRVEESWVPFEEYFKQHSDAQFSHSLCPTCVKERYGSFLDEIEAP